MCEIVFVSTLTKLFHITDTNKFIQVKKIIRFAFISIDVGKDVYRILIIRPWCGYHNLFNFYLDLNEITFKFTIKWYDKLYITFIVRCCIYLTTYDWIKSFLKITIEGRAIYGNLENKINTLYWPVENFICQVTAALCNLLLQNLTLTLSEIKKYCNR
jgi:hypothetical protein